MLWNEKTREAFHRVGRTILGRVGRLFGDVNVYLGWVQCLLFLFLVPYCSPAMAPLKSLCPAQWPEIYAALGRLVARVEFNATKIHRPARSVIRRT